jgi:hypothetical protein
LDQQTYNFATYSGPRTAFSYVAGPLTCLAHAPTLVLGGHCAAFE